MERVAIETEEGGGGSDGTGGHRKKRKGGGVSGGTGCHRKRKILCAGGGGE